MKEIIKSSMIESLGFIIIQVAIKFSNGMIAKWFVYPIEFLVLFIGLFLVNVGFKMYIDKTISKGILKSILSHFPTTYNKTTTKAQKIEI